MSVHQIRRVPVVDGDNRPIGLLSLNDIARSAASLRKKDGPQRELLQTLAAICQPRRQVTRAASAQARSPSLQPVAAS